MELFAESGEGTGLFSYASCNTAPVIFLQLLQIHINILLLETYCLQIDYIYIKNPGEIKNGKQ